MKNQSSTVQPSSESLPIGNANVVGSAFKGYWIICVQPYDYEGQEIPKGRMKYHQSTRPVVSNKWRRATSEEIETRQYHNGNAFNLMNV